VEIFTHNRISWSCNGCHNAHWLDVKLGASVKEMAEAVSRAHRELTQNLCPRVKAALSGQRSYLDKFIDKTRPHFELITRDLDELDLSPAEKKGGPMIIIGS
jgi:hypothetical protein